MFFYAIPFLHTLLIWKNQDRNRNIYKIIFFGHHILVFLQKFTILLSNSHIFLCCIKK